MLTGSVIDWLGSSHERTIPLWLPGHVQYQSKDLKSGKSHYGLTLNDDLGTENCGFRTAADYMAVQPFARFPLSPQQT